MKFSICNNELDKLLFSEPKKIVVYGEAATGKTNILLNIIKCSHIPLAEREAIFFISTEGLSFSARVSMLDIDSSNIFFSIAIDQHHIIVNLLEILRNLELVKPMCIIIDSINYHYRTESITLEGVKLFIELLSFLDVLNKNGLYIISSAQVRAGEEEVIPGYTYLHHWADTLIELERETLSKRILRFRKPKIDRVFKFSITVSGIRWLV